MGLSSGKKKYKNNPDLNKENQNSIKIIYDYDKTWGRIKIFDDYFIRDNINICKFIYKKKNLH